MKWGHERGGKVKHYFVSFLNLTYRQMVIYKEYDHYRLYDDFCPSLRHTSSSLDTNQNIESQSGYGGGRVVDLIGTIIAN